LNSTNNSIIDLWYQSAIEGKNIGDENFLSIFKQQEYPGLISTVFERQCNLQCAHCFYKAERATAPQYDIYRIEDILQTLVNQISQHQECFLLHAGRILRKWHIPVLRNVQMANPSVKIGLIDNGSYTKLVNSISFTGLLFDWIDISLDGTLKSHNKQRKHSGAFKMAHQGLVHAQNILKEDGQLTALFTLTTINSHSVAEATDIALRYADEFHLSLISSKEGQEYLIPKISDVEKMWKGIINAVKTHGREKIMVRMYSVVDFLKLANIIGYETISHALLSALVIPKTAGILLDIDGVCFSFFPSSLWPKEEIIVDADGSYRIGYSGQFTLTELQSGYSKLGENILPYTISKLNNKSKIKDLYPKCVETWWNLLGKNKLKDEINVFQTIIRNNERR